jgi:hypothetical protein
MKNRFALPLLAFSAVAALTLTAGTPKGETFGKPLAGAPKVSLTDLQKSPDDHAGKTIQTEGNVSAVCVQKGCWMTLGQGARPVRVTFKDYGFFVPKDIGGATAVVEGVFTVKTIPEATAKHYAEETPGGKPDEIKGDQKELAFEATGVEVRRAR